MALLAAWTLISAQWSGAPARAIIEFDRTLLYLLVLVLMGAFGARSGDLDRGLRWVGGAIAVTCLVAVLTRLLPEQLTTTPGHASERLGFPLTYWNAMGLFSALGLVLGTHLTASERGPAVVRILAAGALPVLAVTLYFTFSRGGIIMAAVGVVTYAALAHPRGLVGAVLAGGLPALVAVRMAYGEERLADPDVPWTATADEARHVLVALGACVLAAVVLRAIALVLDRRLAAVSIAPGRRRAVLVAAAATALAIVVLGAVAFDAAERIETQRRAFVDGNVVPATGDLRDRFAQAGNNGRVGFWRVAREAFSEEPLTGEGAGTYALRWERTRPAELKATEGHSLYLEIAGELGVPGLALATIALLALLWGGARRLRGPERHAGAAFVSATLILLVHAGVDWDWEMPVLFAWCFGLGGVALARDASLHDRGGMPRLARLVAGLACLLLAVTPALMGLSQSALNRSVTAFERRDCRTAIDAALDSIDLLSVRAEPYEILGYCDARAGQHELAMSAMQAARDRDPENWQYAYGLAVTRALAGRDPRSAAQLARRLNPRSGLARGLERGLRSSSPERRRRAAARSQIPTE